MGCVWSHCIVSLPQDGLVLNSVVAGKRSIMRVAVIQGVAVTLVSALFLVWGIPQALAAAVGGAATVLGGMAASRLALGGGVSPAATAMMRLVLGMLVKWLVLLVVLLVGLAVWKLPPWPLFAGIVTGLVVQVLASARLIR